MRTEFSFFLVLLQLILCCCAGAVLGPHIQPNHTTHTNPTRVHPRGPDGQWWCLHRIIGKVGVDSAGGPGSIPGRKQILESHQLNPGSGRENKTQWPVVAPAPHKQAEIRPLLPSRKQILESNQLKPGLIQQEQDPMANDGARTA
ncbi:hypothetical protein B0H13DRAFT_1916302 [Mycena leptocephala]|nr:hypothetical protein B0H13DRAFT_1916302 [Mycena leptocephala]